MSVVSSLVFDTGQPAGVNAPTHTLTRQNPYPPTKGTGLFPQVQGSWPAAGKIEIYLQVIDHKSRIYFR